MSQLGSCPTHHITQSWQAFALVKPRFVLCALQATPGLLALLHQQGITSNAQPVTQTPPVALGSNAGRRQLPAPESALDIHSSSHSSSYSLGSNAQLASRAANRVGTVEPVALSPAGPAVFNTGPDGGGASQLVGPGTAAAAAPARNSGGAGEVQGTQEAKQEQLQQQPLMPLLQR